MVAVALMSNDPRDHHIVTAGYLRRFARAGKVTVHRRGEEPVDKGVRAVAYVRDFWQSPELAEQVEAKLGKGESAALKILRQFETRWPLGGQDRLIVATFLAIHMVRLPAFGWFMRQIGERANRDVVAESAVTYDLDEQQQAVIAEEFRREIHHVRALLRQLPRIGSFLCSMHWTLLEAEEDWFITSDQPVVLLPYQPSPHSPASAVPPLGLAATLEARFTLDARHALLLSWHDDTDSRLSVMRDQAASINCGLEAQALQEWFSRPGSRPPILSSQTLQRRLYPVSLELLPGYTLARAAESDRRRRAEAIVLEMVEGQTPASDVRWVAVAPEGE
jgi:hypothetical protein